MVTLKALKGSETALTLEWSDGAVHHIAWQTLRDRCPCATCRGERQQAAAPSDDLLPVLTSAPAGPVQVKAMRPVGNYAYGIEFSDGHHTGIFSLEFLRQLGEEAARHEAAD